MKTSLHTCAIFATATIICFLQVNAEHKPSKKLQTGSGKRGPDVVENEYVPGSLRLQNITSECPESEGYFADANQCDKYYVCQDGKVSEEKLCPDGMVFNDFSPTHEKCDLPFNIDCSQRPKLQTPKPTPHCQRLNGYFHHEDANVCNKFYYCVDGQFNMITCPEGLVYSEKTGICAWPDEAKKKGCLSQDVFNFKCPTVDASIGATHPRYPDSEDCQFFYVCINGEVPRKSGCKLGQVFNDATKTCDWAKNVPECVDWYKGVLSDQELDALQNPKPVSTVSPNLKRQKKIKTPVPDITSETAV